MSLFGIADLHLSLGTSKPMDVFRGWENYVDRLEKHWRALVTEKDTVVIAGDISWAMTLEETAADFSFLQSLPGRKLLMKGNHDYWWTTRRKMEQFLERQGYDTLEIVHNSAAVAGDFAVAGTRGWFYDAEEDADHKIVLREAGRLDASLRAAAETGKELIAFLHYPPICGQRTCPEILDVLRKWQVRRCYYGHLHGPAARTTGPIVHDTLTLRLISCDAVDFTPVCIASA